MAELVALTFLMGLILIGLLVAIPRLGARRRFSTQEGARRTDEGQDDLFTRIEVVLGRYVRSPTTWYLGFFVLTLGLAGGAVLYVSGPDVPPELLDVVGMAVAGVLGLLLAVFLFLGIVYALRGRGRGNAEAALVGFSVLGTALMILILIVLVIG